MATKKQLLKIIGMHCTSCSLLIDGDLEDSDGVVSAKTNYARQVSEVTFDDEKINLVQIMKIIQKAGYEAELS